MRDSIEVPELSFHDSRARWVGRKLHFISLCWNDMATWQKNSWVIPTIEDTFAKSNMTGWSIISGRTRFSYICFFLNKLWEWNQCSYPEKYTASILLINRNRLELHHQLVFKSKYVSDLHFLCLSGSRPLLNLKFLF